MTEPVPRTLPRRLDPLDAIRFIAALFVALYHGPKLPGEYFVRYFSLGWDMLFFGSGVVMVFFVVSGICIHYPVAAAGGKVDMLPFLVRRYIRILPPVVLASLLAYFADLNYSPIGGRITWSLLCELGYYSLYPALLFLANRFGWRALTLATIPPAYIMLVLYQTASSPIFAGIALIFQYLPCWVCGCWAAECLVKKLGRPEPPLPPSSLEIWLWRVGIVAFYSTAAGMSYYHVVHYIWFMIPFSLLVAAWISREILFFKNRPSWKWLANLGLYSYSLYLVHEIAHHGLGKCQKMFPEMDAWFQSGPAPIAVRFFIVYALTIALTFLFAKWIEWPFQYFAREFSRKVAAWKRSDIRTS